jgi:hypothetical protein
MIKVKYLTDDSFWKMNHPRPTDGLSLRIDRVLEELQKEGNIILSIKTSRPGEVWAEIIYATDEKSAEMYVG